MFTGLEGVDPDSLEIPDQINWIRAARLNLRHSRSGAKKPIFRFSIKMAKNSSGTHGASESLGEKVRIDKSQI
jgi:hypothetical protein